MRCQLADFFTVFEFFGDGFFYVHFLNELLSLYDLEFGYSLLISFNQKNQKSAKHFIFKIWRLIIYKPVHLLASVPMTSLVACMNALFLCYVHI